MSKHRDRRTYSFKRHRDALYAILEAAVAGGGAQEDDDAEVHSSGGGPSTASRSREGNDGGQSSGETNKTYPSDFLWYEEMTPEDIDAYHSAHRGTPGSGGGAPTADPSPLEHRATPPTAISSGRDHRHGGQGCSEASDGYGDVAAVGDGEVVVAEEGQGPPLRPAFSPRLSTPLRPTHHASATGNGKASDAEFSSQLAVVSSSEMAQTPLIYSSSTSNDLPTPEASEVPRIPTATTAVEDGSLGQPSKRPRPSSPQQEDPHPFDKTAGQEDQGAVAAAVAAASSSSTAAAAAAAATALPITDSQAHHAVGRRRWPEARENSRPATAAAAAAAAAATMTLSASEQSQATQSMFLPGLPSQLLVTQQQGDGGWDHVADGNLQEEEEEEEEQTAASEYALSLPAPHDESIGDVAIGGVPESPPDLRGGFDDGHASSRRDAGNTERLPPGGGSGGAGVGEGFGPEIRARQNEGFTCVLRKFAGGSDCERRGVATGLVESARRGDGRGERARQRLVFVPTQEVLPSGWVSGQAGVVGVLEDHLLRARERFSDGYAVRALELACQVFRQTSVCVRTRGSGQHDIGQGVISVARQIDSSGDAVALPACDHAEVVGVTALVWEILRVEIMNQRCAGLI